MNPQAISLSHDIRAFVRYRLSGRRGAIPAALVLAAIGLAFGWGWLAAAGIAPVLLSLLPCAAMCALGLCMQGMGGRSCSNQGNQAVDGQAAILDARPTPVLIPPASQSMEIAAAALPYITHEPADGGGRLAVAADDPPTSKERV